MFRFMGVLLVALSLCGTAQAWQKGTLAKVKAGLASKASKVFMVGSFAVLACVTACDEVNMGPGKVADVIDNQEPEDVTEPTAEDTIKIGMNYLGDRDPNALDGAELAVAQINEAGGLLGKQLELIAFDNEKNQTRSIEMTKAIITEHGVVAFIGPEYSSHALLTGPVVNDAGIPMISTTATNPNVALTGEHVRMVVFTDSFQGWLMAKFAIEDVNAQTAAILTKSEDAYSVGLSKIFLDNFGILGGNVVAQEFYPIGAADYSVLLNAVAAKNPDVLFIPGHAEVAEIAKQARALDITATFLGGDGWGGADLVKDGGDAVEGSFFSDSFYTIPTAGLSEDTLNFIGDFVTMHGKSPITRSAAGFDAVHILANAIRQTGSLDGETISAAIGATKDYSGATFIREFTEEGYPIKNAIIKEVKDGGVVFYKLINP